MGARRGSQRGQKIAQERLDIILTAEESCEHVPRLRANNYTQERERLRTVELPVDQICGCGSSTRAGGAE